MVRLPPKLLLFLLAVLPVCSCDRPSQEVNGRSSVNTTTNVPETIPQRDPASDAPSLPDPCADLSRATAIVAAATSIPDPEKRRQSLEDIVLQNAPADPDLAGLAYAALSKEMTPRREVTGYMASVLANLDADAALEWSRALKREEERSEAFACLALAVAHTSPPHAARLATKHLALDSGNDATFVEIARLWAAQDPATAASWIARFPDGPVRKQGFLAIYQVWDDQPEVVRWLDTIDDPSVARDAQEALLSVLGALPEVSKRGWAQSFQRHGDPRRISQLLSR